MYSRQKTSSRRYRRSSKPFFLLAALAVVLCAMVGTTVAYLFTKTDPITNTFTPTKVTTEITENFDKDVKNDVQVKNTGEVDAYIRAAVVVTWQNDDGEVYPTAPAEGTDYTVTWTMDGWEKNGDYYYYKKVVKPEESTGVLLTDCKPVEGKAPEGYHLSVEILASAIQANPSSAIEELWKVNVDADGNITDGGN